MCAVCRWPKSTAEVDEILVSELIADPKSPADIHFLLFRRLTQPPETPKMNG